MRNNVSISSGNDIQSVVISSFPGDRRLNGGVGTHRTARLVADSERLLPWWLQPHNVCILTVLLSIVAWLLPMDMFIHGFDVRERFTFLAVTVLLIWYGGIYLFAMAGYLLGVRTKRVAIFDGGNDKRAYLLLSSLAWISIIVIYTLGIGLDNAITFVEGKMANLLRYSLEERYVMGIYSLRWLTIPAGGVAVYRFFFAGDRGMVHVVNMIALVLNSLITSRLSLVAALLIAGSLATCARRIRLVQVITIAVLTFLMLTALNLSRNEAYYRYVLQIDNPVLMNVNEMVTYLAAPFQGFLAVANRPWLCEHSDQGTFSGTFVVTTYFVNGEKLLDLSNRWGSLQDDYRMPATIWPNLTTNSAFATMYISGGIMAYVWVFLSCFIGAFLVGHFQNYANLARIASLVLLYPFAELWRVYMFNAGIIHLAVLGLLLCTVLSKVRIRTL